MFVFQVSRIFACHNTNLTFFCACNVMCEHLVLSIHGSIGKVSIFGGSQHAKCVIRSSWIFGIFWISKTNWIIDLYHKIWIQWLNSKEEYFLDENAQFQLFQIHFISIDQILYENPQKWWNYLNFWWLQNFHCSKLMSKIFFSFQQQRAKVHISNTINFFLKNHKCANHAHHLVKRIE